MGKPRALRYAPITVFFPLPHEHPWPASVAVAKWMTQGDLFPYASSEKGLGCFTTSFTVTNYYLKLAFKFSHQVTSFSRSTHLYYWWFSNDITCVTRPNRGRWHYNEQVIWACWKGFATKSCHAWKLETFCNKHLYRLSQPPLQLFLLPFPALTFSFLHVYSLFFSLGRQINIGRAQGLCYDIFIVCVHVEDVDVNTAFYHTLNAALANKSSRF